MTKPTVARQKPSIHLKFQKFPLSAFNFVFNLSHEYDSVARMECLMTNGTNFERNNVSHLMKTIALLSSRAFARFASQPKSVIESRKNNTHIYFCYLFTSYKEKWSGFEKRLLHKFVMLNSFVNAIWIKCKWCSCTTIRELHYPRDWGRESENIQSKSFETAQCFQAMSIFQ